MSDAFCYRLFQVSNSLYLYNSVTKMWEIKCRLLHARSQFSLTVVDRLVLKSDFWINLVRKRLLNAI